jgi:hypothetical protein
MHPPRGLVENARRLGVVLLERLGEQAPRAAAQASMERPTAGVLSGKLVALVFSRG